MLSQVNESVFAYSLLVFLEVGAEVQGNNYHFGSHNYQLFLLVNEFVFSGPKGLLESELVFISQARFLRTLIL